MSSPSNDTSPTNISRHDSLTSLTTPSEVMSTASEAKISLKIL